MRNECDDALALDAVGLQEWSTVDDVVSGVSVLDAMQAPPTRKAVRDALRRLEASGKVSAVFSRGKTRFCKVT